jgi:hypothetical protein
MSIQEAKSSTNVRLKLRSRQENALIFLTAGRTDYCMLSLSKGRIKFYLKIEEYETEVFVSILIFQSLVFDNKIVSEFLKKKYKHIQGSFCRFILDT